MVREHGFNTEDIEMNISPNGRGNDEKQNRENDLSRPGKNIKQARRFHGFRRACSGNQMVMQA